MNKSHEAAEAWYVEQKLLKKKKKNKSCAGRQHNIELLQKIPYDQYMLSDHWKRKRQQALKHYGYFCNRCKSKDRLQVHHKTYERLDCERISDLEILCRDCHCGEHQHEKPWIKDSLTEEYIAIYRLS